MIHVVTGGSASGKSAYGEALIVKSGVKKRYYLATMHPYGEEGRQRVEKHRAMRKDKYFQTVECYNHLEQVRLKDGAVSAERAVLLECMSNLIANEQFEAGGSDEEIISRIQKGIETIEKQAELLVIVTNEVFSDGCCYDEDTLRYIRIFGRVNRMLSLMADQITEVVFGIPVVIKSKEEAGDHNAE